MKKKSLRYIFYSWLILIILLNVLPGLNNKVNDINRIFEIRLDYVFHFIMYFAGIYVFWQWKFISFYERRKFMIFLFFVIWMAFSFLFEYFQHYIPGRSYNPVDLLMNLTGVFTASILSFFLLFRKLKSGIRR